MSGSRSMMSATTINPTQPTYNQQQVIGQHNISNQPQPMYNQQQQPFHGQQSPFPMSMSLYTQQPGALLNLLRMSENALINNHIGTLAEVDIAKLYSAVESKLRLDKLIKVNSYGASHLYDTIVCGVIEVNAYRLLSVLIPMYVKPTDTCISDTLVNFMNDLK